MHPILFLFVLSPVSDHHPSATRRHDHHSHNDAYSETSNFKGELRSKRRTRIAFWANSGITAARYPFPVFIIVSVLFQFDGQSSHVQPIRLERGKHGTCRRVQDWESQPCF